MILIWSCSVFLTGAMAEQTSAAQKKPKEQASPITSVKALKPSPDQAQKVPTPKDAKAVQPSLAERKPGALPKQSRSAPVEPNLASRKGHRQVNAHKKIPPKAVVQPRTDLMYYGVLEDLQRYDPRPNSHTAGVPNPQTPDLTHDHFQELDRNQDGKIDPVERAFGRIDMDRDLHNRQPQ